MADSALEQTKACTKCGEVKSFDLYQKRGKLKDRLQSWCRACMNKKTVEWARANRKRLNALAVKRRAENPDRYREYALKWNAAHRDRVNAADRRRYATARGNIEGGIRRSIRVALKHKKAGRHWETLVGYTLDDLMVHLENLFLPGMTWENRGEWHIDHVIPKSAFNYDSPDHIDFKRCWALSNLQPLWATDNQIKHAKLVAPFQPSLAI